MIGRPAASAPTSTSPAPRSCSAPCPQVTIVLREPGGSAAGTSEWVFGSAEYRVGEEVLTFVSPAADGALHTTAMAMGKFSLTRDAAGRVTATRTLGEGASVWDPDRGELIEHPGPEEYPTRSVRRRVARRGADVCAEDRPAADARVRLVPAEFTQAASREPREAFTYLSTPSRWFEPDDGTPISFLIDATGDVGLGADNLARGDQRRFRRVDQRAGLRPRAGRRRRPARAGHVRRLRRWQPHRVQRPVQRNRRPDRAAAACWRSAASAPHPRRGP